MKFSLPVVKLHDPEGGHPEICLLQDGKLIRATWGESAPANIGISEDEAIALKKLNDVLGAATFAALNAGLRAIRDESGEAFANSVAESILSDTRDSAPFAEAFAEVIVHCAQHIDLAALTGSEDGEE